MMAWFWFILLLISNLIWYLVYDALKKMIVTYRNLIMKNGGIAQEVLERLDEMQDDW